MKSKYSTVTMIVEGKLFGCEATNCCVALAFGFAEEWDDLLRSC
jgi:hypothetical protein